MGSCRPGRNDGLARRVGTRKPGRSKCARSGEMGMSEEYPLYDALLNRRSRRFARGFKLEGGPLAFESGRAAEPLTLEQEAALAFAACGTTGPIAADLPYHQGGQIMMRFVGRTAPSGDALHTVSVVVIN